MFGILRDEGFERLVRLSEFSFLSLRFSEQNVRIGAGRRIGVTSDYLLYSCALFALPTRLMQRSRGDRNKTDNR